MLGETERDTETETQAETERGRAVERQAGPTHPDLLLTG